MEEQIKKIQQDINDIKELMAYNFKYGCAVDNTPVHIIRRIFDILQKWKEEDEDESID